MEKTSNRKLWLVTILWIAAVTVLLSSLVVGSVIIGKNFWDRSQAFQVAGQLDINTPEQNNGTPLVQTESYQVTRVIDGDTIVLEVLGTVRIIGIDTPELRSSGGGAECFAQEAKREVEDLVKGKSVYLEYDSSQDRLDRYGRTLAYVFLQNVTIGAAQQEIPTDLGLQLIRSGYAFEYTYRNPYKYQQQYKQAEIMAREQEIGLWNPLNCNRGS
jgi:micrococcal nuclease